MIIAFDVQYYETYAKAVAVCFSNWSDPEPMHIIEKKIDAVAEYTPGEFYKRELPCIQAILTQLDLSVIDLIIVDGYVYLDNDGKLGLGGHLYNSLHQTIPVIGVAKSKFHNNHRFVEEVLRGTSTKPLYITAIGLESKQAKQFIASMHGNFRMPTLLQILDTKTKEKSE